MTQQPKLMDFSLMRNIFEHEEIDLSKQLFINGELAILYSDRSIFNMMIKQKPPFSINDYRLGMVLTGEARININLVEKRVLPGMLVFIGPGSIINPISISPDFSICGIGLSAEFPLQFATGQLPATFNGQIRDFRLAASGDDISIARQIVDTLWAVTHSENYNRRTVASLVSAQLNHYDGLYRRYSDKQQEARSREQTIFDRFLYLVNRYSRTEHSVGFYAQKMCLSERYLSTVVRKASGTTAKEWIDRSIIAQVKVELRHSAKSVNLISEEMNFPNPSFFSKYFKRLTAMTPLQYRQES